MTQTEMYNWGFIRSGSTFQALVNALLRAENPGLIGFSRSGKDGAQDARSMDGTKVWQAKYHSEISGSRLISDAKGELTKIEAYKKRTHARYRQWKDVTDWELVTTDSINPTDQALWDSQIVDRAKKIGLKASYMERGRIEELLTKHTDIAAAFFGGANRCLLSLDEARDFVSADTISVEGLRVALVDRDAQIDQVKKFLESDKKLVSVIGPGGIGKTRFLLEAGAIAEAAEFQVLWGLEAGMAANSSWLVGFTPEQKTLLLVDEPKDPRLIDQVVEQLKNSRGRMELWKVIISSRAQKGPILEALGRSESISSPKIELLPLGKGAAKQLALDLLNLNPNLVGSTEDRKGQIAEHLSTMAHRIPVWMILAVEVLGRGGRLADLPDDSEGIARRYVNELIENTPVKNCSPQQLDQTVKWLSLCGEIDIEDRTMASYVSKRIPFSSSSLFVEVLEMLVTKRFAVRRGVNRNIISIKPDVIRDFVVRDWLITEVEGKRKPSAKADELVQMVMEVGEGDEAEKVPSLTKILRTIATLEFSQSLGGDDIDVLSPFMARLMNVAEEGSTIDQDRVMQLVQPFAFARLSEIVELSRTIRLRPRKDEIIKTTFYGDRTLKHRNVVLSLPWLLFNIAPYARSIEEADRLYAELLELCRYECEIEGLPANSGRSAKEVLPRLFEDGRNYLTNYGKVTYDAARRLLSDLSVSVAPTPAQVEVMSIVVSPFMSLERSRTSFDGKGTFTYHQFIISLSGADGQKREELISLLRRFAADNGLNPTIRTVAWRLLSNALSSAGRVRMQLEKRKDNENFELMQAYIKANLSWVLNTIHLLKNIADLKAARQMWDWHVQFEKDPEIMAIAKECEAIYLAHRLVKRFHTFFDFQQFKESRELGIEVAAELAQQGAQALNTFLSEAKEFAGSEFSANRIIDVSIPLADHWDEQPFIGEWIDETARQGDGTSFQFALCVARARLHLLRTANRAPELRSLLGHIYGVITTDECRQKFLETNYLRPHPLSGLMTAADLEFFQEILNDTVLKGNPGLQLHCLLGMHHVNERTVLQLAQQTWTSLSLDSRFACFCSVLEAVHFVDLFRDEYPAMGVTPTIYAWLMSLLVDLPSLDDINDNAMHDLEQFVQRYGKMPTKWIVESIQKRKDMKSSLPCPDKEHVKVLSWRNRLPRFCQTIEPEGDVSAEARSTMDCLVQMYKAEPESRFFLLEYLTDVDPFGRVLPEIVISQINQAEEPKGQSIREWAALAGHYDFNSSAWRKIAISACGACTKLTKRDMIGVFVSLCSQELKSSEYNVGDMDPRYLEELNQCQRELQDETDPGLISFREWRLATAQGEYDRALAEFNAENED